MKHSVKIWKKNKDLVFKQMTEGSAGYDVVACIEDPIVLKRFIPVVIPVGVFMAMPPELEAQIRPRSSLSRKGVLVSLGTIDSDYRGEVGAVLTSLCEVEIVIAPGDRIGQVIFSEVANVSLVEVETRDGLGESERGAGGFGSTGR